MSTDDKRAPVSINIHSLWRHLRVILYMVAAQVHVSTNGKGIFSSLKAEFPAPFLDPKLEKSWTRTKI